MPQSCEQVFRGYAALNDAEKAQLRDGSVEFGDDFNILTSGGFAGMLKNAGGSVDAALERWGRQVDADYATAVNRTSKERADLVLEHYAEECAKWQNRLNAVQ